MPQAPRAACTAGSLAGSAPALPSCRNGAGDKSAAFSTLSSPVSIRKRGTAGKNGLFCGSKSPAPEWGTSLDLPLRPREDERDKQANFLFRSLGSVWVPRSAASRIPTHSGASPTLSLGCGARLPSSPPRGSRVRSSTPARSVRSENLQPCGDLQPVAPKCDTFSKSPLPVVPHRIVPGVPGDFVLNPVPLLSPRLRPLLGTSPRTPLGVRGVSHLESRTRSAFSLPPPHTARTGKSFRSSRESFLTRET